MEIFNAVSKQMDTSGIDNFKPTQVASATELKPARTIETSEDRNNQDKKEIEHQLKRAVKNLNNQMDRLNTDITFGYNDKINSMYVDVKERSTGKLIRKFPSEEAMKLTEHFKEVIGIIFDEKG